MKKLLFLGGSKYIVPLIKKAQSMGIYTITCDYLPNNIAHQYSNEYVNLSIIDKEKVLQKAQELHIDGICSFACDPGVITAAYVAEKMGLPAPGPYESVVILQNKNLFRKFLKDNNFNVPWFKFYNSKEDVIADAESFIYPLIVKPVDSAGSKGVSKVDNSRELENAIDNAFNYSINGKIIVEEYLDFVDDCLDTDAFSVDGELVFCKFSDMFYDSDSPNPFVPIGDRYPTNHKEEIQNSIREEIQRLLSLLHMKTSIYNIESRLCGNNKTYLMEVAPRGGGNRIAESEAIVYNFDFLKLVVESCLNKNIVFPTDLKLNKYLITYCIHSNKTGVLKNITIHNDLQKYVIDCDLYYKSGDSIKSFTGANNVLGFIQLAFDDAKLCNYYKEHITEFVKVELEK